jgi:hypothetical protein
VSRRINAIMPVVTDIVSAVIPCLGEEDAITQPIEPLVWLTLLETPSLPLAPMPTAVRPTLPSRLSISNRGSLRPDSKSEIEGLRNLLSGYCITPALLFENCSDPGHAISHRG